MDIIWVIDIGWGMITVLLWKKIMHWSIYRKTWYRVIRFLPRYRLISLWHFRCLPMGKIDVITEVNFVLFNSMLKYVKNRLMHAFFHFKTVIIPRPISTLGRNPITGYFPGVWKYGQFTSSHIGHTKMPLFELSM
jgi:hypothetical protein